VIAPRSLVLVCALVLAALSFFEFPGHTFLQSDTQIYMPILEHLRDSSVLANDLVAEYPHVSFTIYDEVLFALHFVTRFSFEHLLLAQEFLYRAVGILGIYLLGTGLGLSGRYAMLLAAILSLGATVNGPAVLTVEYEPVPRGFALPFVLLALGLIARHRWDAAAIAAGIGFLFHPPTALAFIGIYLAVSLWTRRVDVDVLLVAAGAVMFAFVIAQRAFVHTEDIFATLTPWLEAVQRLRASYNWVETWISQWAWHYIAVTAVGAVACWRCWERIPQGMRVFLMGLPVIGILSIPVSYLFLSKMKLAVMPQLQPGRYLLFVTFMAVLFAAIAAIHAAARARYLETFLFFTFCFLVPMEPNVLTESLAHYAVAAALAGLTTGACYLGTTSWSKPALTIACIAPFFVIPDVGHVRNFAQVHSPDLDALAGWARTSTEPGAMFQFADVGQRLEPGIFRTRSLRAIYADWKGGGQVNYLKEFAEVWWPRWQQVRKTQPFETYGKLKIDYVVYLSAHRLAKLKPVYQNQSYVVYATGARMIP